MGQFKNSSAPGAEFIFTENGLSLEEMAAKLHSLGYLSDADMAEAGGVSALRRKLYDGLNQNRHHYSSARRPWPELTEAEAQQQLEDERLTREVNECADALGVNDPEHMAMIILASDLREFSLEISGRNIVLAEILATAIQKEPASIGQVLGDPTPLKLRLLEMVKWVLDGREERR